MNTGGQEAITLIFRQNNEYKELFSALSNDARF